MDFAIYTGLEDHPWGGSEELWSQAAVHLLKEGHHVSACLPASIDLQSPRLREMEKRGASFAVRSPQLTAVERFANRILPSNRQFPPDRHIGRWFRDNASALLVVSLGQGVHDFSWMERFKASQQRYVIVVQAVLDHIWLPDALLDRALKAYRAAERIFFVSEHNRRSMELQLGENLSQAEVLYNPYQGDSATPFSYSIDPSGLRLACVARLNAGIKGHGILLQVLAGEKWRRRDVQLSVFGTGINKRGLERLCNYLGLDNVTFHGHQWDIPSIWRDHHLGILTSRSEGLPLCVSEAMIHGRPNLVTDAGGSAEIVTEGKTGFIAEYASVDAVDAALERAWKVRERLPQMGQNAYNSIRDILPEDPAREFAEKLLGLGAETSQ